METQNITLAIPKKTLQKIKSNRSQAEFVHFTVGYRSVGKPGK